MISICFLPFYLEDFQYNRNIEGYLSEDIQSAFISEINKVSLRVSLSFEQHAEGHMQKGVTRI